MRLFSPFVTETETEPSSGLVLDSALGSVSGPVSVSVTNGKKKSHMALYIKENPRIFDRRGLLYYV
jgi:hypothetical protein